MTLSVPILMYHRIAEVAGDRNSLPPAAFAAQLAYLKTHGYQTLTLAEVFSLRQAARPLPGKTVVLTFDDGYEDNYRVALPLLKQYGMRATVFVVAGWIDKPNDWEDYPGKPVCRTMNWTQLREWQAAGNEIGSHTVNHPFLSQLNEAEITAELRTSKEILENGLQCEIPFLCYPYGDFDARVQRVAAAVGYQGALAIFNGTSLTQFDAYALPRIVIPAKQSLREFAWKVSKVHHLFTALRIAERRFKTWWRK